MKKYFFVLLSLLFFVVSDKANNSFTDTYNSKIESFLLNNNVAQKNNFSNSDSAKNDSASKKIILKQDTVAKPVRPPHKMHPLELSPKYPGGINAALKFIADSLRYPAEALKNNISGTVFVDFRINRDGSVSNVTVRHGIGYGCDEEAVRVIKLLKGWQIGGRQSVPYGLPVKFEFEEK